MDCLADVGAVLGEGPVWVAAERALYWLDIPSCRLFCWTADAGVTDHALADPVCSIAPRSGGGYVGGSYSGFVTLDATFAITPLVNPEQDLPGNRFNDGKVDRAGRFWAGTMDRTEASASGSLYRLDPDGACHRIDTGYRVTNGPAFSVDGRTMYHNDSALQRTYAFDLDADGNATGRRVFAQFGDGDGYPDGMTVDADDHLWIAFWDGWCVRRISPAGQIVAELNVPVQRPTSVAFGDDALDTLFITSARRDLADADLVGQPQAGGLFAVRPGVTGIAERPFAG